ncbi:MAG: hypothetical protein IJY23_08645 [Clostridia bacterium]|nr:hypothetical protein [Clostridia bacterium]
MNINDKFPTRQTHLDFHTSPDIEGIGSRFSKENFQKALKLGNLDSITIFAKCHHGVCYYPTKVGTMHPHLDFDLTGAMLDAAHEIGVRAPIYITAGWSHADALKHPEWRSVSKDGRFMTVGGLDDSKALDQPRNHCCWHTLCLNDGGAYAEHIYEITEEVCRRYDKIDGLFFDICIVNDVCYCESCKKGMLDMGFSLSSDRDAREYFIIKRRAFMEKCTAILKKYHPDATIFFNSGGAHQYKTRYHSLQTHFEMEDLPTAWGGYDKLPVRAKFFANSGKAYLGMTGKFHLAWGEFGGFKTKEALKYEVATMALYGAGASIGDHMHPDGEMEMQTYENIGYAYDYLEKISPFCYGGEPVVNLGLYCSMKSDVNSGVSNILLQNQIDFGIVADNNFSDFDTVIIPEGSLLDEAAASALRSYVEQGGKVVAVADSLVKDGKFILDMGLEYVGAAKYDCDYIVSLKKEENIPNAPMLCNLPGHRAEVCGAEVFAELLTPYFSRTNGHFCGHKNTPHDKNAKRYPAIAKYKNVVYLSHPLASEYNTYGSLYHREYFLKALKLVYFGGALKVSGLGSQGRCTMISQPDKKRYCINMTYAVPVKRGVAEIIEDIMPVYNVKVSLNVKENVKRLYYGVTGEKIEFEKQGDEIHFTVAELNCHTSIVAEY